MRTRSASVARRRLVFGALALMSLSAPTWRAEAQIRTDSVPTPTLPDSAQTAALIATSQRMRSPAAFALDNRRELALTPEQVGYLEALVPIEADSMRVRMRRMMEAMQQSVRTQSSGGVRPTSSWTGPLDEAAIRAVACEQSKLQADMVIGGMRDRHAVGAVLTPVQHSALDRLQTEMMQAALKRK